MVSVAVTCRLLGAGLAVALSAGAGLASPAERGVVSMAAPEKILTSNAIAVRDLLETAVGDKILSKSEVKAIEAFYEARDFSPVWIDDGLFTAEALAVIARIRAADTDGLSPQDYALPSRNLGIYLDASPALEARSDLLLSQAVIEYAHDAHSGRVTPTAVSSNFSYEPHLLDSTVVLEQVTSSPRPVDILESYHPQAAGYQALRQALADVRAEAEEDKKPVVPDGGLIKPGMNDDRVAVIRERLEVSEESEDPTLYDETVVTAVKDFQRANQLKVDGIVGRRTVAAMNRTEQSREAIIIANLERWRWMPEDLGGLHVWVNIPEYELRIYKDDAVVHKTRVVVGKIANKTPIFSDEIEHVVVNPVWNVPASITRNEMLPRLRAGSSLSGYTVYTYSRGKYRAVNPRRVNWRRVSAGNVRIKQRPGRGNALGQVKFLFPNKHAVYLHDTPSKSLFERDIRAFSHGCVRVKDPWDFAEALLAYNDEVDGGALRNKVGGGEKWTNLDTNIPVHITYFTAWVDDEGELQTRNDIYGHDRRLNKALGTS